MQADLRLVAVLNKTKGVHLLKLSILFYYACDLAVWSFYKYENLGIKGDKVQDMRRFLFRYAHNCKQTRL